MFASVVRNTLVELIITYIFLQISLAKRYHYLDMIEIGTKICNRTCNRGLGRFGAGCAGSYRCKYLNKKWEKKFCFFLLVKKVIFVSFTVYSKIVIDSLPIWKICYTMYQTRWVTIFLKATNLRIEIDEGIKKHAVVDHPRYGKIYAYEVVKLNLP